MKPKMIWANLGVNNLDVTTKFYMDLGFKPNGEHTSKELTSFFFGADEFVIHFFQNEILSKNLQTEISDSKKVTEVQFTLSASGKEEVDQWEKEVEKAGGTLLSKANAFGDNYYGFDFADPDGHRFNVFYMKGL